MLEPLRRFENCDELHARVNRALDKAQARGERVQQRHRTVGRRMVCLRFGAARQILDPGTRRTTRWGRAPRRRGRLRSCRSSGLSAGRERRLPDARWDRLLRSASLVRARGAAGLAQVDAEPDAWNSSIIIAVIRQPAIIQEILDLLIVVTTRDCGKLEVEDVGVPQPILHHIVPHLFFCADEPINLCNGNVSHTEDAGRLGVDRKSDD